MRPTRNVLVVAAHPDDETLGCGGTLQWHKDRGDKVYWLIITKARPEEGFKTKKIEQRKFEIDAVSAAYGFEDVICLDYPSICLDQVKTCELIANISQKFYQIQPQEIYIPFKEDVHSDHRILFQAVFSCTKSFRYPFIERILMMETLSETEFSPALPSCSFTPNVFVDISKYIENKIAIMKLYSGESGAHPFPRSAESIKALATIRGATSNCLYAESFMLLKEINR